MNPNRRSLILMLAAVCSLLVYSFYSLLIVPQQKRLTALQSDSARFVSDNALLHTLLEEHEREEVEIDEIKVQQQLPLWDNTEEIVEALNMLGEQHDIQYFVSSYSVASTNTLGAMLGIEQELFPNVQQLTVAVSLRGQYGQLRDWLESLQKQERLIVISKLEYVNDEQSKASSAQVEFAAFFDPSYKEFYKQPLLPE